MKALKDSVIYLIGELASKCIPFLLLPYLSRKLGVAGYGELSYFQTYLALFAIVLGLSQEGAVARYFYFYGKRSVNLIVHSGYLYTLALGTIFLIICAIVQSEIMAYLVISAMFQSFLAVQLTIRQAQKQAIPYTLIQLGQALSASFLTILFLEYFQTDLVEKRILAILVANAISVALAYFIYWRKTKVHKSFSFTQRKVGVLYILGFGLPLILHHASIFLKGQLDRIFIYHQFSQADLGLYAMGAQIATILAILVQAVNKAMVPYLFEGLKQQRINLAQLHKYALFSFVLVPIPALIMWILPESLLIWILGEQFVGTKYYVVMFLFSTMLLVPYLFWVNYLFYYGKNKLISYCSIFSTLIYVASLILLSLTEIKYVPFASIIGAVAVLPMLYLMTNKVHKSL